MILSPPILPCQGVRGRDQTTPASASPSSPRPSCGPLPLWRDPPSARRPFSGSPLRPPPLQPSQPEALYSSLSHFRTSIAPWACKVVARMQNGNVRCGLDVKRGSCDRVYVCVMLPVVTIRDGWGRRSWQHLETTKLVFPSPSLKFLTQVQPSGVLVQICPWVSSTQG